MEHRVPDAVPYMVYETHLARDERTIRRLWILCIIIFAAFVISNLGWMYYESQFEDEVVTQTVEQDVDTGNGDATVNGAVTYGAGETDGNADSETESP